MKAWFLQYKVLTLSSSAFKVEMATDKLKTYKSPDIDEISAYLI